MSDDHFETFGHLIIDPNNPCAIQMVDEDGMGCAFAYVHGLPIEGTHGPIDARRIAACWNACEGIPTEALEAGVVEEMLPIAQIVASMPISDVTPDDVPVTGVNGVYITHGDVRAARRPIAKAKGESK